MYTTFMSNAILKAKIREMEEKQYKINKILLTILSVVTVALIVLTAVFVTM